MNRHFLNVFETASGWKVNVWDGGTVTMCEWNDEKKDYVDRVFATKEEAEEADKAYNDMWKD